MRATRHTHCSLRGAAAVNELKSIAEHHTATVQGIEALVNRSTVCVETVMGISAAVEEMKAEQATRAWWRRRRTARCAHECLTHA
jgi:hypothetical protein